MPGIRLFGRRFNFSSDDLTIPSLIDISLRLPLGIIYLIFRKKDQACSSAFYTGYFYPLLAVYAGIALIDLFICIVSLRGTPVNNTRPRRHMPLLIYLRLVFVLVDIFINVLGLIILIRVFQTCELLLRGMIITSIVLSWFVTTVLMIILMFFVDLTGVISTEQKWKMRLRLIFCCDQAYGTKSGDSSDMKNIVETLQYLFDDERFDLVASDVAAGLILLQQEDLAEERSIDTIENVPLELLKEGLYYNSYAQSAFGWFSMAYQYRFTFIPRMLFAMRFRTIGLCCCCFGIPWLQYENSLFDPWGSQYSTLQYLLRKQKPIILYGNFLGAFGKAPFYIAADNEKKTIIVSIRGTLTITDILTDINIVEDVLETELFGNGYCHSGMHAAANYIREEISARLIDIFSQYPNYSLIICGYSLGAGIAAILAIQLKSLYPHTQCYGIAMPGSVLSENLVIATRHFIYSYVVDVDMIVRASMRSLEHLRDRLIDALNKCHRNKLSILTRTFARTLIERRQVFHTMANDSTPTNTTISQVVLIDHRTPRQPLVIPGTIIHLYSTDRVGIFTRKASYRACISAYDRFTYFIVHPRMLFDHFPASYSTAFADVIENYHRNSQTDTRSSSSSKQ